jgi:hypothetical protein
MIKKLIGFTEELIAEIDKFSAAENQKSFTDSVRILIEKGLECHKSEFSDDDISNMPEQNDDLIKKIEDLEKEVKRLSWWTSDDNTHRMTVLEGTVAEIEKRLNVVVGVSKHFKGHLDNRSIHLQD